MHKILGCLILSSVCGLLLMSSSVSAGYFGLEIYEQDKHLPPYEGIKILYVHADSVAAQAGLQANDVILTFDNTAFKSSNKMQARMKKLPVGSPVHVRYWRAGETREIVMIAGEYTESAQLYRQARALANDKDYAAALKLVNQLVSTKPDAVAPRFLRARILLKQQQYQALIKEANQILKRHELPAAYAYRADAYQLLKDYDSAIRDYDQAIRLKSDNPQYYNSRGYCYREKGDLDRAFFEFTRAIEVDSGYAYGYKNRADILRMRGQIDKARQEYGIAAKVFIEEALKYKNAGRLDIAIKRYTSAINLNTAYTPSAHYNRGLAYEATKDYQNAIQDYSRAIQLNPRSSAAFLRRGFVYAQVIKDYNKAESDWQTAARLDPQGQNGKMARKNLKALDAVRPATQDEDDDW